MSLALALQQLDTQLPVHISAEAQPADLECPEAGGNRLLETDQFYKTRICRFHQKNRCRLTSDECLFAHDPLELRSGPNLEKTKLCGYHASLISNANGSQKDCPRGRQCMFAHSLTELRSTHTHYKTKLCAFYERGNCRRGNSCRHAHGLTELRSTLARPLTDSPLTEKAPPLTPCTLTSVSSSASLAPKNADGLLDDTLPEAPESPVSNKIPKRISIPDGWNLATIIRDKALSSMDISDFAAHTVTRSTQSSATQTPTQSARSSLVFPMESPFFFNCTILDTEDGSPAIL